MCPCEYCGQSFTHKARHAAGCSVLYQVALACRAHGLAQQSECKLSVRGHTAGSESSQAGRPGLETAGHTAEGPRAGRGKTGRATTEVPEGQGQGGKRQEGQRGIRSFFPGQSRVPAALHDGTDLSATRGLNSDSATGQGLLPDVQDQGRGNDPGDHQRSGQALGGTQGGQKDRLCEADRPPERCAPRAAGQSLQDGGERGQSSQVDRAGLGLQAGRPGTHVATTCLERGEPERYSPPGLGATPPHSGGSGPRSASGACLQPGGAEVSCHEADGPDLQRGDVGVCARDQRERVQAHASSRSFGDVEPLRHVAVDRRSHAARASQALAKKIQHWLANGSLPYRCATQEIPVIRMPLSCLGSGL